MHCFRDYAVFKGRAARPEYGGSHLFNILVTIAIYILNAGGAGSPVSAPILYGALTLLPYLAVASRRLHDTGHSFWWVIAPILVVVGATCCCRAAEARGAEGDPSAAATLLVILLAFVSYAICMFVQFVARATRGRTASGYPAPTTPG